MAHNIVYEYEEKNNFLADVYNYMEEHNCDKNTAVKVLENKIK